MRNRLLIVCVLCLVAFVCRPSRSAEPAAGQELAGLMDETAIALVRFDLTDEGSSASLAARAFFPQLARAGGADAWLALQRALNAAGARSMTLIVQVPRAWTGTTNWLDMQSVAVLATDDPAAVEQIAALLRPLLPEAGMRVETHAGFCLVGAKVLVERALAGPHPPRGDLAAALAAAGDAPLAVVFAPSPDQRHVFGELLPELPAGQGGKVLREWGTSAWTTIAYDPDRSLRVAIQTESPQAAIALGAELGDLLDGFAAQVISVGGKSAPFGPLVGALERRVEGDQVLLSTDVSKLASGENLLRMAASNAMAVVDRRQAMNRLKQIGIAFLNNHDIHKRYPDAAIRDAQGKPLLSWRVHVLPFLDQKALYDEFHLDEPWDSEHNRKLIERMPDVYRIGSEKQLAAGKTCVVVPLGEQVMFPEGRGRKIREVTDGTSRTILVVEADDEHAVPWTKPDDLVIDLEQPAAGLGGHYGDGFVCGFADGSAHFLSGDIKPETLRAVFTAAGEEVVDRPFE